MWPYKKSREACVKIQRQTDPKRRRSCEVRGKDWGCAAICQRFTTHLVLPVAGRDKEGPSSRRSEVCMPASILISDFQPPELWVSLSPVWLCDPMTGSPPGSSVPGILQARILERVVISSSVDLPNPGIKLVAAASLAWADGFCRFFAISASWEAQSCETINFSCFKPPRLRSFVTVT